MTLLNLSYVTKSLSKLVEEAIKAKPELNLTATVSPLPPDELKAGNGENVLGLYLYHVSEDPHFKNLPSPGNDSPPVRYSPMGLTLHYQLTANAAEGANKVYNEQFMIGLAMKAFHDYPVIDGTTNIDGVDILDPNLSHDDRLRISLLPLPYNEAVSYWTAGSTPLRLAAYYEVSVVLLEPEEIRSRAGRVLHYDVFTSLAGAPRLFNTENSVSINYPPGEASTRKIVFKPAEAAFGEKVTFIGKDLIATECRLLLNHPLWDDVLEVDPAVWGLEVNTGEVKAIIQRNINHPVQGMLPLSPGVYSAQVKLIDELASSDGGVRRVERSSNFTPFTVVPHLDDPGAVAGGVLDVGFVAPGFSLDANVEPPGFSIDKIQFFIGESRLVPGDVNNLNKGEFGFVDENHIKIHLKDDINSGYHPVRLIINGAESHPRWFAVP